MRDPKSAKHQGELQDAWNSKNRCCLGHLGYSMGATTEHRPGGQGGHKSVHYSYGDVVHSNMSVLPVALAKELDMTQCGDFVEVIEIEGADYCSMSSLNDSTNLTSAEIADVIEAQYKVGNVSPFGEY